MPKADRVHSTPPTKTPISQSNPPHAPAIAATAEPAIYYKTPVTPEEAFQAIGRLRKEARDEIDRLIRFLDKIDNHMEREPDDPDEDGGDTEPSLGSFDRMTDQSKAWRQVQGEVCFSIDAEQDDCDHEDDDPAELGEPSGIGDWDGMLERIGGHHSFHGRVID